MEVGAEIVGIEVESEASARVLRAVAVGEEFATMPPANVERSANFAAGETIIDRLLYVCMRKRCEEYVC